MTTHPHIRHAGSVAPYALGALPELEATALERHLESCASCRAELELLRPALEALPRGVEQVTPPASLKRAVLAQVRAEARDRRRAAPGRLPSAPRRLLAALLARPATSLAVAATVVAGAIGAAHLVPGLQGGGDTRRIEASVDRVRLPAAHATVVVSGDRPALLRVSGMPELRKGRVYEVWLKRDGAFIPGTLFTVRADGTGTAALPREAHGADAILVTRERAGGARNPSGPAVIRALL